MTGTSYQRRVLYFSEYQGQTIRMEAAGFGRIGVSGNELQVHISLKEGRGNPNWKGYCYYVEKEVLYLVLLGELQRVGANWVLTTSVKADNIKESNVTADRIAGVLAMDGESHYCSEAPLGALKIAYVKHGREPKQSSIPVEEPDMKAAEETETAQQEALAEPAEADEPEKIAESEKITESQKTNEDEPEKVIEVAWTEKIMTQLPEMYPFEDDEMDWCGRLEPKDFGLLPSDNWTIAKNSFLLEAYYTYRHLIFAGKKENDRMVYYIGVPGNFHRRECFMANMFGFPYFKGVQKKENTLGDFGYWFKRLS